MESKKLTESQKKYIKDHYLKTPIKQIARDLGYSSSLIRSRLKKWNLIIPKSILEERKRSTQRKPGDIPFNKGKKIETYTSKESLEKIRKTQFKKGNKPHNTKTGIGHISKRRDNTGRYYLHIKISEGNWILYHRYLWEKENGKIPKGHIIAFVDQDTMNCSIDNLEMISYSENMRRNTSEFYNESEPVKKVLDLNYKLIDKIKAYENSK